MQIPYYVSGEMIMLEGDTVKEVLEQIAEIKDDTLVLKIGTVTSEGILVIE